jgi:hypothetical protein
MYAKKENTAICEQMKEKDQVILTSIANHQQEDGISQEKQQLPVECQHKEESKENPEAQSNSTSKIPMSGSDNCCILKSCGSHPKIMKLVFVISANCVSCFLLVIVLTYSVNCAFFTHTIMDRMYYFAQTM